MNTERLWFQVSAGHKPVFAVVMSCATLIGVALAEDSVETWHPGSGGWRGFVRDEYVRRGSTVVVALVSKISHG